jgi:hypothetical protein
LIQHIAGAQLMDHIFHQPAHLLLQSVEIADQGNLLSLRDFNFSLIFKL